MVMVMVMMLMAAVLVLATRRRGIRRRRRRRGDHRALVLAFDGEFRHQARFTLNEDGVEINLTVLGGDDGSHRVEAGQDGCKGVDRIRLFRVRVRRDSRFGQKVRLVQENGIGAFDLLHKEIDHGTETPTVPEIRSGCQRCLARVVSLEVGGVHDRDERPEETLLGHGVMIVQSLLEEVTDVLGLGHSTILQNNPVKRITAPLPEIHELLETIHELVLNGTTSAPILELQCVGEICSRLGRRRVLTPLGLFDQLGVDVDRRHVVHDAPNLQTHVIRQDVTQQGRLSGTQEARKHQHRNHRREDKNLQGRRRRRRTV